MTKKKWTETIIEICEKQGTYQEHYGPVIDTLAGILEKRDAAEKQYVKDGALPIITVITDRNKVEKKIKNPSLQIIMDLNHSALEYWRELGLTPSSLKKLNGDALTAKATTAGFEALLAKIGE